MSDPIRSISQNNFLLATQPDVKTDNTLSGNGTAQSPLGLNETVLFDGTKTKDPVNSFTLTEYASNFERIRFYGIGYGNTKVMYECQAPDTSTEALSICYTYYCRDTDNNPFQLRMGVYTTIDGLSFTLRQSKFLYAADSGTTFAGGNNTQGPSVYKVVGINRKSST